MRNKKRERVLYIRELERFTNRIVNFCSKKDIDKEEFDLYVEEIFKPLTEIEKVFLSNEYLKALEKFVESSANISQSDLDIEEIKEKTLYEANQLRKLKRKKKYSRISKKRSEDG